MWKNDFFKDFFLAFFTTVKRLRDAWRETGNADRVLGVVHPHNSTTIHRVIQEIHNLSVSENKEMNGSAHAQTARSTVGEGEANWYFLFDINKKRHYGGSTRHLWTNWLLIP